MARKKGRVSAAKRGIPALDAEVKIIPSDNKAEEGESQLGGNGTRDGATPPRNDPVTNREPTEPASDVQRPEKGQQADPKPIKPPSPGDRPAEDSEAWRKRFDNLKPMDKAQKEPGDSGTAKSAQKKRVDMDKAQEEREEKDEKRFQLKDVPPRNQYEDVTDKEERKRLFREDVRKRNEAKEGKQNPDDLRKFKETYENTSKKQIVRRPAFVHAMTWNVNGTDSASLLQDDKKSKRLHGALEKIEKDAVNGDLVLIGLEEIVSTRKILGSRDKAAMEQTKHWAVQVPKTVGTLHLVDKGAKYHETGVALLVYECRSDQEDGAFRYKCGIPYVLPHKSGYMGKGGSKGTLFCDIEFIGNKGPVKIVTVAVSHLPAYKYTALATPDLSAKGGRDIAEVRKECMKDVWDTLQTENSQGIIWMGDFNSRLKKQPAPDAGEWPGSVTDDWKLKDNDELAMLMDPKNKLDDKYKFMRSLSEASVKFPSTYKVRVTGKKPKAAEYGWTDRILYNFGTDKDIDIVTNSYTDLPPDDHIGVISDHSPVIATFRWVFDCNKCARMMV